MIGDSDLAIPSKMLDLEATRHKLAAHNIANAGVPGYRKLSASFSDELLKAIQSGDPEAVRNATITVQKARAEGVDGEAEVASMAKNEIMFNTFAEIASFRLRMLRMAVTSK